MRGEPLYAGKAVLTYLASQITDPTSVRRQK